MGTPEFSIPSIDMLFKEGKNIIAVITKPDTPKGRGNRISMSPVKKFALKLNKPVLQPESVRTGTFINGIRNFAPDLLVTVAYGKILPKEILDIPKFGCINVHASLLPKYRGAAPINWAIINGESKVGITTMLTDVGMDTGNILLKKEIEISEDITAGELHDKLSYLGAIVLKNTLECLEASSLISYAQDHEKASYAPIMTKDLGHIDWSKQAFCIHNLVRGTNPWPGAYTSYMDKKMKVWKTEVLEDSNRTKKPGMILSVSNKGILVSTGDGIINIKEVQFDSCRSMTICEYICGNKIIEGEQLG